jgi:hypothetical protein
MPGKYEKKQAEKQALSGQRIQKHKDRDGRDRKFSRHIDVEGEKPMEGPLTLHTSQLTFAVGDTTEATPKGYVDTLIAGRQPVGNYAPAGHSHNYVDNSTFERFKNDLASSNTGKTDGHSHNISFTPFMKYPREERLEMLGDRADLEDLLSSGLLRRREEIMARNLSNVLRLLMDYEDFHAFERERRFDDPEWAEWTEDYKKAYGIDEYEEESRSSYMRHGNVQMHPRKGIVRMREEENAPS